MKKNDLIKLKRIGSRYKSRLTIGVLSDFFDRYVLAFELWRHAEENVKERGLKQLARKNFVINLVTTFEVLLKDVVICHQGKWNNSGFAVLLKDQRIDLSEAFELFSGNRKITREDLINHFYSFQNLATIDKIFSNLSGQKDFLGSLGDYRIGSVWEERQGKSSGLSLNKQTPEWYFKLSTLFSQRHQIIHENKVSYLKERYLLDTSDTVFNVANAFLEFTTLLTRGRQFPTINEELIQ